MKIYVAGIVVLVAITNAGMLASSPFFASATSTFITAPTSNGLQYNVRYANNPVSYFAASTPIMRALAPSPIAVLKAIPPPIVATMRATPVSVATAPVVKSISPQVVSTPVVQSLTPVTVSATPVSYTYSGYSPLYSSYILRR